jgi:hypothetical protein
MAIEILAAHSNGCAVSSLGTLSNEHKWRANNNIDIADPCEASVHICH